MFTCTSDVFAAPAPIGQLSEHPSSNDSSIQAIGPSNSILHPSLLRRHNQVLSLLDHLSPSNSHAKRSLTVDLFGAGLRIIFDHFDLVVAAALENWRMQEAYKAARDKLKRQYAAQGVPGAIGDFVADPVYIFTFAYGTFKFVAIKEAEVTAVTPEIAAAAVIAFLETMVELLHNVPMFLYRCWLLVEHAGRVSWVLIQMFVEGSPVQAVNSLVGFNGLG
ncbi:MAG: hypothetical protein Q9226_003349 [Calogaya cf. arnoldii]